MMSDMMLNMMEKMMTVKTDRKREQGSTDAPYLDVFARPPKGEPRAPLANYAVIMHVLSLALTHVSHHMRSVMPTPWRLHVKRLAQFVRPCKTLVLYPLTWVVLALIMLTHLSFAWWFQPTPVMQSLAAVIDIFAVLLWGVLALQSTAWRALDSRMPYETTTRQVQKLLAECPAAFAIPARRCLELAQHISQEFTEAASRHELDALMSNIAHLAHAHRTLHLRAQHFGTPEQKASMASMIHKHVVSVENTLQTLPAFSGNLTLLSARVATDERALQELHFLNQGLQEVL